jgi:hypothetical protein
MSPAPPPLAASRLAPQPSRRFVGLTIAFLLLFSVASPFYLESTGVLALAGFIARAAAVTLGLVGVSANAAANVLWTPRGGFLVTQECITTPDPCPVWQPLCLLTTWRRLMLGVLATCRSSPFCVADCWWLPCPAPPWPAAIPGPRVLSTRAGRGGCLVAALWRTAAEPRCDTHSWVSLSAFCRSAARSAASRLVSYSAGAPSTIRRSDRVSPRVPGRPLSALGRGLHHGRLAALPGRIRSARATQTAVCWPCIPWRPQA